VHVAGIWRYPVKSMQGEPLDAAEVEADGLRGDRSFGIRSLTTGRILTGRRRPELLLASARLVGEEPEITLPDGSTARGVGPAADSLLSRWLDEPVELVAAAEAPAGAAEYFADATDDTSAAIEWTMPAGRFVDAEPVLLVTGATLETGRRLHPDGDWNVRRFRPNLLVAGTDEGWPEDGWLDRTVTVGDAAVVPRALCQRCTMVTRPQPQLARDLDVYRTLLRSHGGTLGVWSGVATPGHVRLHDPVRLAISGGRP
jgi:uncharacterized protein